MNRSVYVIQIEVKLSLYQAVESYRVVRRRGSHIVQSDGSEMALDSQKYLMVLISEVE
jgi:acetolactate synthase regulatory subunit